MRRETSDYPLLIIHQWIFQKPTFSTPQYDFKQTGRRWRFKEQFLRDCSRAVSEVSFEIRPGMTSLHVNRLLLRKTINFLKREPFCVTLVNILIAHDFPVMAVSHVNTMLIQKYKPRVMCATSMQRYMSACQARFHPTSTSSSHARTKKGITRKYHWTFCNETEIW